MSAPVAKDHLPTLRAALLADSALVAACTGGSVLPVARVAEQRIYSEVLPAPPLTDAETALVLPPTVVIATAGGLVNAGYAGMAFARVELRAYHRSRNQARALWFQALAVLLNGPFFDLAGGVHCEVGAPGLPIADVDPNGFFLARAMVGVSVIYH